MYVRLCELIKRAGAREPQNSAEREGVQTAGSVRTESCLLPLATGETEVLVFVFFKLNISLLYIRSTEFGVVCITTTHVKSIKHDDFLFLQSVLSTHS